MRFFIFSLAILCSCSAPPSSKKPVVLVSIAPYQFFVERLAKGFLEVHTIVPPGVDAHSFEPTPRQRKLLQEGKIWFQIGESFERSLPGIVPNQLNLCEQIELFHHDRHIWMSPKLAKQQVSLIAKTLREQFPEHRNELDQNEAVLLAELTDLDEELAKRTHKHTLLVSHPSFGYFCREYGLQQLSIEFEGKDPRPRYLESLIKQGEEKRSELIAISMPQYNNKGLQMVADHLQIPMHQIDPYAYDYFAMMHELVEQINDH